MKEWRRSSAWLVRITGIVAFSATVAAACGDADDLNDDGKGGSGEAGMGGAPGTGGDGANTGGSGEAGTGGVATSGGNGGERGGDGGAGPAGAGGGDAEPCGNGTIEDSEACDDRNVAAGDGCFECGVEDGFECDDSQPSLCEDIDECEREIDDCHEDAECTNTSGSYACGCNEEYFGDGRACEPAVVSVATGEQHSCAVFATGELLCWGLNNQRQLGYTDWHSIGDDETPASAGPVDVGGAVRRVVAGMYHTCALLDGGTIRCWGANDYGQLGYANLDTVGETGTPAMAGDVNVGGTVEDIAVGSAHTCALLTTGNVRCWGWGDLLGYGNTDSIGDDEVPASAGYVDVGGAVQAITAGASHSCALLTTGSVRCWGTNQNGQVGYPTNNGTVGDDETPAMMGDVDVGGTVRAISAGNLHTCALLTSGYVRCWGYRFGADGTDVGDDEPPSTLGTVPLGFEVRAITDGPCAVLATGGLRCWGPGSSNLSSALEFVQVEGSSGHTCALLSENRVRCWGAGADGRLGYASTSNVSGPEFAENVRLFPFP